MSENKYSEKYWDFPPWFMTQISGRMKRAEIILISPLTAPRKFHREVQWKH
jgi:hypothetical protein